MENRTSEAVGCRLHRPMFIAKVKIFQDSSRFFKIFQRKISHHLSGEILHFSVAMAFPLVLQWKTIEKPTEK